MEAKLAKIEPENQGADVPDYESRTRIHNRGLFF
jgi:hypothetical protein